ncbi:unnamed protein product [Ostreobium quekettii]|uniref:WD repeat-containing protein 75 second beta-propeller domain-containing protein n=1 Tax=Ostreobium quekettii TaxID=121088 RepID=A0A8S1J724_9CHLO|nr:unnamed protein product [Ostreobium quekettii]|eukprot:evm.model.scf_232EXC.1 EVM.evm.TU.scf_232EXC.1   scf_232EXC:27033-32414(+)
MDCGGGRISDRGAIFSSDGRCVLSPGGGAVHVFSRATGARVASLKAHDDEVTTVQLDPGDPTRVYAASLDGSLSVWDYAHQKLIKKIEVSNPVCSMVIPSNGASAVLCCKTQGSKGQIVRLDLQIGRWWGAINVASPCQLVCSPSGKFFGYWLGNELWIKSTNHDKEVMFVGPNPFVCVTFGSDDKRLAAGDATGRISLWNDFTPAVDKQDHWHLKNTRTVVHWHANNNCLQSLCFSPDCVFLLSGGKEAVLVIWEVETLQKRFLARLGSTILSISVSPRDPALYVLGQDGNAIRVVNTATDKTECSILGISPCPRGTDGCQSTAASVIQPGSGYLVVPTNNSVLQFYNVRRNKHVAYLQTAPRNQVSLTEAEMDKGSNPLGPPAEPHVSALAFNRDASVLVTVGTVPQPGPSHCVRTELKFWDAAGHSQEPYELNTIVNDPHGGLVSSLCYSPSDDSAVTTSSSGDFKVWHRRGCGDVTAWHCRSVGSYRGDALVVGVHIDKEGRPLIGGMYCSC